MRRLAVDLTYQPTGGTLNQIIQIIENIESYNFDDVIFYLSYDNLHLIPNNVSNKVSLKQLNFSKKSIILRTIWAQLILPLLLIFDKVDVLFCPGNISPIINTKKKVQWIHTIGPFEKKFISSFPFKEKFILIVTKYLMIFSSYTSDMVIFESNYTRDLFINRFKQKIDKSSVIHSGNDDFFKPVKASKSNFANDNVVDSRNFIFTVSHLYPYKNLELLIDSYYNLELYKKELYILVAGSFSDQRYYNKLQLKLSNYSISNYVIFLGRLEKEDLRYLYSQCKIFIFTSLQLSAPLKSHLLYHSNKNRASPGERLSSREAAQKT